MRSAVAARRSVSVPCSLEIHAIHHYKIDLPIGEVRHQMCFIETSNDRNADNTAECRLHRI